jgi:hypothetical protein
VAELDEFEQRVLAELDEVWEDNVFSLLNSILDPTGEGSEVRTFVDAVASLIARDMVVLGWQSFYPSNTELLSKSASTALISALAEMFEFRQSDQHWGWRDGDMKVQRYPIVCATEKGHEWGRGFLNARGFRWWIKG